jgi:outer membrane receptor protein involved in Fe transport
VYWHRHNEEQTREDLTSSTYRLRELDNAIDQIGLDVEARSSWTDVFSLTWGAMIQIEKTDNGYREFRSPDGSEDPSLSVAYGQADWENKTTISDGAKYETKSIFTQLSIDPSGPWSSLVGLRFSRYDWSFGDVDGDTSDFTWSLRTVRDLSETQNIFVGVSKAFRAPNLTNLDGAVDRGSSGQFAFGNPDLDPEVSLTIEGGWRYANDDFKVMLTIFDTQVEDLIQDVGTGSFDNLEDAHLWGAESRVTWSPNLGGQKRLSFFNDVSLVRGRIDVPQADGSIMRDNISRANRVYGRSGARYVLGHGAVSLQWRWHDAYDHVATSDAGDVRLTIPGDDRGALPGYAVLDLRFERALGHRKSIACGLENILDKNYREPGSGVDGPGRNAFLQLAWSW